jgi:hypothetical protein
MNNVSKTLKKIAIALVVVLLMAQFVRMDKSNPPVRSDLTAPAEVTSIVRRACYNCHSNETSWPWYAEIAPVSWLVANDVREGREHLNFSEWGSYDGGTQSHKLRDIAEEVQDGEMPPWYYSVAHGESRLAPSERNRIFSWASGAPEVETR